MFRLSDYLEPVNTQLLVHWVYQLIPQLFNSRSQLYFHDLSCQQLEACDGCLEADLSGAMLVAEYHDGLSLGEAALQEFQTVSKRAGVSGIWMKYVLGPMFSQLTIVSKRANYLELKRPLARDEDVR
jgi:hypothetical protein